MNSNEYLIDFYNHYDEDARLTSKHGRVEFLTTMRYIDRYLQPGMRLIEIGAATGRYSHTLARRGFRVDAVELVEHNIEIFKQKTLPNEPVTITQGNALDLSAFNSGAFDVTLLLGPMYHLYTEQEQLQALSEAIRVTKKGGVIFVAYCMSDATVMDFGFGKGEIFDVIEKGILNAETLEPFSRPQDLFKLYRKEEIDRLRNRFGVTQLHFVATDGYTNHIREAVDDMDDAMYEMFLKYHFLTCERQDLIGYSHHTLDIFRKEEA